MVVKDKSKEKVMNMLECLEVSWIRRRDFHVLTVGMDTYTTDDRFESVHMEKNNDWTLKIKFAQLWDEGMYECQVSSDPKISLFVNLSIVVAKASILGPHPLFLKTGSSINLTCVITESPEPPVFVFWYHDDRMINYDSSRGDITMYKNSEDSTTSRLYIKDATAEDSGNYTCCPSNTQATSIPVYVLNGERPAAIQHDANISTSCSSCPNLSFLLFLVLTAMVSRPSSPGWEDYLQRTLRSKHHSKRLARNIQRRPSTVRCSLLDRYSSGVWQSMDNGQRTL
ncbi:hypothetical protein JTE90_021455 [Oedothorax gibbosus]|uniref:Ig-like domain-containing protein n=1 Tax=Oedothorax gibbosus TaxID=931172 RepID=A0AAV6VWN3_9ARAC|nr:hypothetical protein JTE90_021455 [Oedothorax gibbosus]